MIVWGQLFPLLNLWPFCRATTLTAFFLLIRVLPGQDGRFLPIACLGRYFPFMPSTQPPLNGKRCRAMWYSRVYSFDYTCCLFLFLVCCLPRPSSLLLNTTMSWIIYYNLWGALRRLFFFFWKYFECFMTMSKVTIYHFSFVYMLIKSIEVIAQ